VTDTGERESASLLAENGVYLHKEAEMTAVQAVYDGKVFIPEKPCELGRGTQVTLIIEPIDLGFSEKQKKLAAFRQLTREIKELQKTDPLPPEFDAILSQRVHFREIDVS
jgi:predicted DNA-binding antitoxin AbrB/MazE fold protein